MTEKKQATKLDFDRASDVFKPSGKKAIEPILHQIKHNSSFTSEHQSPSKFTNHNYKQQNFDFINDFTDQRHSYLKT